MHNTHFFQLYTIHFELARGINPVAIYYLVQNKIQVVYDRMLNKAIRTIILASPERILLTFEGVAINAFRSAFPSATVTGCYFHLTQSIMRKVNKIGLKENHERIDILRLAIRCLPALDMVLHPKLLKFFDTS